MLKPTGLPTSKDKTLFTPGPLTTSLTVKQAMLRDAGSWHFEFNEVVRQIRSRLIALAGLKPDAGFEAILMQGSGSFGVEAVLASAVPAAGKVLFLSNGAYAERMISMAQYLQIEFIALRSEEHETPDLDVLRRHLAEDPDITHVATVHCETTTGILNPIHEIGKIVQQAGRSYIVDAMSSFGAIPIDFDEGGIDYLISSANKCLEGVPGFSFVLARRQGLEANEGFARSLCLDLLAQLKGFDKNGQFRYSPPTHSILAFAQALDELDQEGGIEARANRYRSNHRVLIEGMQRLGFKSYLDASLQSFIITSFFFPESQRFEFGDFYRRLSEQGMIIYPGKIAQLDLFRIGTIGRIFEADIRYLLTAIGLVLTDMGVDMSGGGD